MRNAAHSNALMYLRNVIVSQLLLLALDNWSAAQSADLLKLLTAFMEPVLAAIAAFDMLENAHKHDFPHAIRTRDKIMSKLSKFIAAKGIRAELAAINTMFEDAMLLLERAVGVANLVQGGEIKQIAEEIKHLAQQTEEALR
jgi:hypothetical protein